MAGPDQQATFAKPDLWQVSWRDQIKTLNFKIYLLESEAIKYINKIYLLESKVFLLDNFTIRPAFPTHTGMHAKPFSGVWLCEPMDCTAQDPLSMGFSRQGYWSTLLCPPPGDLPDPGIELASPMSLSCIGRWLFTMSTNWEAQGWIPGKEILEPTDLPPRRTSTHWKRLVSKTPRNMLETSPQAHTREAGSGSNFSKHCKGKVVPLMTKFQAIWSNFPFLLGDTFPVLKVC